MNATEKTVVTETEIDNRIGECGSLIIRRAFTVQRPGRSAHTVIIEFSHSGAPQETTCDCDGFKYRGKCSHIDAVYDDTSVEFPCYDND